MNSVTVQAKVELIWQNHSTLFGGPSQPEPLDERGGIQAARRKAMEDETVVNPNQYENDAVRTIGQKWRVDTLTGGQTRTGKRITSGRDRRYSRSCLRLGFSALAWARRAP